MIDKELLSILACPRCKGNIRLRKMFFTCSRCRLAYPVLRGDIPDMLIEDAWKLDKAKKAGFRHDLKL